MQHMEVSVKITLNQFSAILGVHSRNWINAALEKDVITDALIDKLNRGYCEASVGLSYLGINATDEQIEQASTVEVPLDEFEERILKELIKVIADEFRQVVDALDSFGKWRQE